MEYIVAFLVGCALAVLLYNKMKHKDRVYPPSDPETPEDLRGKQ